MATNPKSLLIFCSLCVAALWTGCSGTELLPRSEIVPGTDYDICEVITTGGEHVVLNEVYGRSGTIKDSTIVGLREDGKVVTIPLSEIQSVQVTYFDTAKTLISILGITIGALFVAAGALSGVR
jgi:hypothetical protein